MYMREEGDWEEGEVGDLGEEDEEGGGVEEGVGQWT